jgi:hypothetical protein
MARPTFADFDARLLLRLGNRTDITADMRNQSLDSAYYYVANVFEHPALEKSATATLSAAAESFTLSVTDFWWPTIVKDTTNNRVLIPREMDSLERNRKTTGNPGVYAYYGDAFYVDRKPSASTAMKVFYVARPAEPSSSENSVLDAVFDMLIPMYGAMFAFEDVRDFDERSAQNKAANEYLGRMKIPWRQERLSDASSGLRVRMR